MSVGMFYSDHQSILSGARTHFERAVFDAILFVFAAKGSLDHDVRASGERLGVFGQFVERHNAMPEGATLPFIVDLP